LLGLDDTIAGIATPPGVGGVAVVRVSGRQVREICSGLVDPWPRPRRASLRTLRSAEGKPLDEALVLWMPGPGSFTGEDTIEFHTHGGRVVPGRVLEALVARGARLAEPGEFSRRAFLSGRMSLEQAEAMNDLIHAEGEAFAQVALDALRGSLRTRVEAARDELLDLSALLEANLDFPEEDVPELDRGGILADLDRLREGLEVLATSYQRGRLLREGPRVVLSGRPNAGKSSLLNALLKQDRAIVTDEPGTTRDVLEEGLTFRGVRYRITDTAGLRQAPGLAEGAGVERAIAAAAEADVRLLVREAGEELGVEEVDPVRDLVVLSKVDQGSRKPPDVPDGVRVVPTSALTGEGIEELMEAIHELAATRLPRPGEDVVVTNLRHRDALARAGERLEAFRRALVDEIPYDVALVELSAATHALGSILGVVGVEDVLDRIFERFCIGK
jgi:tRNA modification GTPase